MHKNLPVEPLSARIQAGVDEVVRLLRAEVASHNLEHWRSAIDRVNASVELSVRLVQERFRAPDFSVDALHGNTCLGEAVQSCYVVVSEPGRWQVAFRLTEWASGAVPNDKVKSTEANAPECLDEASSAAPRSTHAGQGSKGTGPAPHVESHATRPGPPQSGLVPVFNEAYLIRDFDRRERERGPIYAGFIVKDLLPRMGFDPSEAKRILRAMEAQDIVRTERKRNPKNPERTTAFVTLNREHPHVVRVLTGSNAVRRTFPIASIDGEQLSETIIRERR